MVIQFLALGCGGTEQRPPGQPKVFPLGVQVFGQQKILLLRTNAGNDPVGLGISKEPENADGLSGYLLQ